MQDFCSKTSRPSSQAVLQATSTSFLEVRRVGCRSGVFFLFILRALSGVRTVRGQVPAEPRRVPEACGKPCGCLSEDPRVLYHPAVLTLGVNLLNLDGFWCFVRQVVIAGDQRGTRENTEVALISAVPRPALGSICPFSPPGTPAHSR